MVEDRNPVGLAGRGGHGEHHAHGEGVHGLGGAVVKVPEGAGVARPHGNCLGRVDDAAASYGQKQVSPKLPGQTAALFGQLHRGILRDAAELHAFDALGLQLGADGGEQAALLHPRASVEEHGLGPIAAGQFTGPQLGPPPEHHVGGKGKFKIFHCFTSCLFGAYHECKPRAKWKDERRKNALPGAYFCPAAKVPKAP